MTEIWRLNPTTAPQSHSFRRLLRIDHDSFLNDLKQTSLMTDPPQSLSPLLDAYDTIFRNLFW